MNGSGDDVLITARAFQRRGKQDTNEIEWTEELTSLCGNFEKVDDRVWAELKDNSLSIGRFEFESFR